MFVRRVPVVEGAEPAQRSLTLEQILFGPTSKTDGTQNLIGALEVCMGMVGAVDIREFHKSELVIAPSIKTEGKYYQMGLS